MTVAHVQSWALIAFYESYIGSTTSSWMSNRRSAALAQLLELHRLDVEEDHTSPGRMNFRDAIDAEQGRRAFWAVFCSDRWASAGTGLPQGIYLEDVSQAL